MTQTLSSTFWEQKIIYIYKISKSDHFPKNHPVSKIIALITTSEGEKEEISYLLVRDGLEGAKTEFFKNTPTPIGKDKGTLEEVLDDLFRLSHTEIVLETEVQLSTPWSLLPTRVREFPDFLKTIRKCPEIVIKPSECSLPMIPWRYRLPGKKEFVEMDALGVLGLEYLEELDRYFRLRTSPEPVI